MRRYIQESWERYAQMVHSQAPPEARDELRRAFFGGASVLFTTIVARLSDAQEATEADLAMMDDIQTEIEEFGQRLDHEILGLSRGGIA